MILGHPRLHVCFLYKDDQEFDIAKALFLGTAILPQSNFINY